MQNSLIDEVSKIVHINEIVDKKYMKKIISENFTIKKDNLVKKLNSINYCSFDKIKQKDDVSIISAKDILNFFIDNRYGVLDIVSKNKNSNLSMIEWTRLFKVRNIKNWFNYFFVISVLTKMMATQNIPNQSDE